MSACATDASCGPECGALILRAELDKARLLAELLGTNRRLAAALEDVAQVRALLFVTQRRLHAIEDKRIDAKARRTRCTRSAGAGQPPSPGDTSLRSEPTSNIS